MTVEECYREFGGDYEGVLSRMPGADFVAEFLRMFLEDETYVSLQAAMEKRDSDAAFRAVHALKGICQNFGYTRLYESSSALTERLRTGSMADTEAIMRQVESDYQQMVATIKKLEI